MMIQVNETFYMMQRATKLTPRTNGITISRDSTNLLTTPLIRIPNHPIPKKTTDSILIGIQT